MTQRSAFSSGSSKKRSCMCQDTVCKMLPDYYHYYFQNWEQPNCNKGEVDHRSDFRTRTDSSENTWHTFMCVSGDRVCHHETTLQKRSVTRSECSMFRSKGAVTLVETTLVRPAVLLLENICNGANALWAHLRLDALLIYVTYVVFMVITAISLW